MTCPAKWSERIYFADHVRHQCTVDDDHEQHICRCGSYTFREFAVPAPAAEGAQA